MSTGITIADWQEMRRGTLVGFLRANLASGLQLVDCTLNHSNGTWWVSPAGRPMIDKNGAALRDPNGKIRYASVVQFESKATRDRFSDAVVTALHAVHPEIFG
jgi:hypothetical protein